MEGIRKIIWDGFGWKDQENIQNLLDKYGLKFDEQATIVLITNGILDHQRPWIVARTYIICMGYYWLMPQLQNDELFSEFVAMRLSGKLRMQKYENTEVESATYGPHPDYRFAQTVLNRH